jgi:NADPH:quinone reductase-like Zn-dependent oxidoreductase
MPTTLQVDRHAIGNTRLVETADTELAPDQVRLEIEFYALTANNITYAQFGDMLAYWDFFPVSAEWGNVPCMGYGRVTESNVDRIEVGQRFYGWWPMATSVDITATPTEGGFRDDGPHRAPHAAVYRGFSRTDLDPLATTPDDEQRHPLLRGLFTTGFLADAFFAADHYRGAEQAIVLSASSKTGIAYAAAAKASGMVRVIGVTSAANVDFVRGLGVYDDVFTYDEVGQVAQVPSVVVDMAGNGAAVAAVHRALGDLIAYSMVIGKSHHDAAPAMVDAGPAPEMFFAPGAVADRIAEWGHEGYVERMRGATAEFLAASRGWLSIDERHGPPAAQQAWAELHAGEVRPDTGLIVSMLG